MSQPINGATSRSPTARNLVVDTSRDDVAQPSGSRTSDNYHEGAASRTSSDYVASEGNFIGLGSMQAANSTDSHHSPWSSPARHPVTDPDHDWTQYMMTYQRFACRNMCSQFSHVKMFAKELTPFSQTVFAAVLFADISGFTRLSARLNVEELKYHINEYFGQLLGVIKENSGDVVKFCGDAVMIMWSIDADAEEESRAAAVLMASVCALQLLSDCGKYDRGEGQHAVSLRLHCGIGCGPMHCMCLGDGDRWEYLISGDPIHQVGRAEPEAGQGEVCISPEAYAFVQGKLETIKMPLGNYKLTGAPKKRRFSQLAHYGDEREKMLDKMGASADLSTSIDVVRVVNEDDLFRPSSLNNSQMQNAMVSSSGGGSPSAGPSAAIGFLSRGANRSQLRLMPTIAAHPSEDNSVAGVSQTFIDATTVLNSASSSYDSHPQSQEVKPRQSEPDPSPQGCFLLRRKIVHEPKISVNTDSTFDTTAFTFSPSTNNPSSSDTTVRPNLPLDPSSQSISSAGSSISMTSPQGQRNTNSGGSLASFGRKMSGSFAFRRFSSHSSLLDTLSNAFAYDIKTLKIHLNYDNDLHMQKVRGFLDAYAHCPMDGAMIANSHCAGILRCFLHEAALDAIESNTLSYLSELRTVTTMFIEVLGLDEDFDIGDCTRPQKVISTVLACLNRFEGSLRQYVVDDKGCVIIAAFGLPGSSHEDNCTRSIETARAINKMLGTSGISCRTGIAMGSVYCGLVGSSERCEYAMMGSSVNLAARLMGKCPPGGILVSEPVFQGAHEDFIFDVLEPIAAKGYDKPVAVFKPNAPVRSKAVVLSKHVDPICPFVGRENILQMFRAELLKFSRGGNETSKTGSFIIEGAPGSGKTSLLSEVNEMALQNGSIAKVIIGGGSATHASSSYFVIKTLLEAILALKSPSHRKGGSPAKRLPPRQGSVPDLSRDRAPVPRLQSLRGLNLTASSLNTISESHNSETGVDTPSGDHGWKSSSFLRNALGQAGSIFSAKHIERWIEEYAPTQKVDQLETIGKYSKFKVGSSDINTSSSVMQGDLDDGIQVPGDINLETLAKHKQIFMIDLVPLLSDILPIKTVENEITASMDPETRWRMCDALLVKMFQVAFSVHKLVIIVENLQWCDLLSLGVFTYIIRDTKGGLFFFTARPVEVHDMWRSKHKTRYLGAFTMMKQFSTVTELPPLSRDEVRKILMAILGAEVVDASPELKKEETLQQIMKRTGCMPFSVVALCLALKNARLQGKFIDVNRLPSGVHNIIVNRFDQLSSKEKVIMKAAAIIGEEFSVALLAETLDQLGSSNCSIGLISSLHDLANAKLIHLKKSPADVVMTSSIELGHPGSVAVESEMVFEFTDQSVRYGIYNLLLEAQRTAAHLVVAKLLEKMYEANPTNSELFAQLVHHYLLSDDDAKKLHFAELASELSRKSGDYKKCINYDADLIKFATNESFDSLVIKSGVTPKKEKETVEHETLLHRVASRLPTHAMHETHGPNLATVHHIFASRHNSGINTSTAESLSPMEMWLEPKKASRLFKLTDDAIQSDISRARVAAWIAEAADAYCRIGKLNFCNNLSIIALGNFPCRMRLSDNFFDKILNFFRLTSGPEFNDPRDFIAVLTAYENICILNLVRGYVKTSLDLLLLGLGAIDKYQDRFGDKISHFANRFEAIHSLLHLCTGNRFLAEKHFSQASKTIRLDSDSYTLGFFYLTSAFHLSAVGGIVQSFVHAQDASRQFHIAQDLFMASVGTIFAGWQAFMCGNISRAKDSYSSAFDFGLRTANRPIIKLSLELFAIMRIMAGDYKGSGSILDQIKSTQHSSHSNTHKKRRPNSFKCALIAFSYVRGKRYKDSVPFIQYAARQLCEMKTYNSVCALFLFFTAYSALECIENGMTVSVTFMKILSSSLTSNIEKCMESLEKLSEAFPCILPLYHACLIKRIVIDESFVDDNVLASIDDALHRALIIPTRCVGDLQVRQLGSNSSDETRESGSGSNMFMYSSESNITETAHMKVLSERASAPSTKLRRRSSFMNDAAESAPPGVGFFDDFSFAMLFLHTERHKLHLKAGKVASPYGGKGDSGRVSEQLRLVYSEQSQVDVIRPETNKKQLVSRQSTGRLDIMQSSKYFSGEDSPTDLPSFKGEPFLSRKVYSSFDKVNAPIHSMSVEENLALLGSIEDDDDPGLPGATLTRNMSLYFAADEAADVVNSPVKPKPTLLKTFVTKFSVFSSNNNRKNQVHPAPLSQNNSSKSGMFQKSSVARSILS